ncbi:MAG: HAMP domain-containing sensor histidine kinase, partial [Bdellovibrionota bacterium]
FNGNEILQKARNFTALWNLKREREEQSAALADLNRMVLESERVNSVAAVARGVTHEFGNLLMQIIGKAEISRSKNENDMRDALDRIIDAGQRASEILDRFNNLSDNKSAGTNKSKHSIEMILNEALDLVGHQLRRESLKVDLDFKAASGILLSLHSTSILQVFINLLINSMHALEGRPNKVVKITSEISGAYLKIVFCDNGPGAPAELLDRLTEPFFTTKGARGTGLGLAICREIIEIDHGGEFKVANAKSGGFEVTLCLNLKE